MKRSWPWWKQTCAAVDAIQSLTGCTFGKGNLIHKDYGKSAFTFYRRKDGKAARLVARPDLHGEARVTLGRLHKKMQGEGLTEEEEKVWHETRAAIAKRTMESELEDLFKIEQAVEPDPEEGAGRVEPDLRILRGVCDGDPHAALPGAGVVHSLF